MSCNDPKSDFCTVVKSGDEMDLVIDGGMALLGCLECGNIPAWVHDEGHHDLETVTPLRVTVVDRMDEEGVYLITHSRSN